MATKLPQSDFDSIYSKAVRFCVELLVHCDQGYLLTLRNIPPMQGQWHLPGGTVLLDESLEQAINRVAKEELSIEIEVRKLLGLIDWYQVEGFSNHAVSAVYLVEAKDLNIKLDRQASKYQFFTKLPDNAIEIYRPFFQKLNLFDR